MSQKEHLLGIFEGKSHQKLVLTVSVFIFLVLELLIYLAAASHSGQKSRIIISDSNGTKVYETPGAVLTSYEKLVFENNFGPLSNYRLQVETESLPFPFRAWLSSAVGIPLGLILLVAFIVRAYLSLLYGDRADKDKETDGRGDGAKHHRLLLGFLSQSFDFPYWIPDHTRGLGFLDSAQFRSGLREAQYDRHSRIQLVFCGSGRLSGPGGGVDHLSAVQAFQADARESAQSGEIQGGKTIAAGIQTTPVPSQSGE
jgi:hypothetical protein